MNLHGRFSNAPAIAVLLALCLLSGFLFPQSSAGLSEAEYQQLKAAGKLSQPQLPHNPPVLRPENLITPGVKVVTNGLLVPLDTSFSVVPFTNGVPPEYRNDDGFTDAIPLSFSFLFYGTPFNEVFINNNGNLSFGNPYSTFTPQGFPIANFPMVAPFWGDVDTRAAESGLVYYKLEANRMIVIWDSVGYYGSHADKRNTFEVIITDGTDPLVGIGNNICFSFGDMQWTTGDASGGSGGFGGSPATVGANKGDGVNFALVGRFDHEGIDYDGPGGNPDGVSYLDQLDFCFNVAQGAGTITGNVFRDDNGNGVRDAGEGPLPGWTVRLDPGPFFSNTDINGDYFFSFLPANTYTVSELLRPNWQQTFPAPPGTHTVVVDSGQTFTGINFGNQPVANVQDLFVSVAGGVARPGFQKFYGIFYENKGTIDIDGDVIFSLPPQLGYLDSSPGGVYNAGNHTVTWDVGLLPAGFIGWLWVKAQIPPTTPLGTALTSSVRIEPVAGDVNRFDNVDSETQIVRGSFDPNDKSVAPEGDILDTDTLSYLVRFQNVGTDTAFNVVVRDLLDANLDLNTLEVGASSHPFTFTIVDPRELVWTFSNINLPDSTTDEAASHGFVKFKIRPLAGTAPGTVISNSAAIYFDFNLPVITNVVQSMIEIPNLAGEITVTPNSHGYGIVVLGSHADQTFVVKNDATSGNLVVSSTSLTGLAAGQYAIIGGGAPFTLTPGQSRNIVVRYTPTTLGSHAAQLRIESNDLDEPVVNVALSGTGSNGVPSFKISAVAFDFSAVTIGKSLNRTLYIWNAPGASADLVISSILLFGDDKSYFSFGGFSLPFTLAPGDTQSISLNFAPGALGNKVATLGITSNDPAATSTNVQLQGAGDIKLTTSVLQNPAASKYADIVVVSDVLLVNPPHVAAGIMPDTGGVAMSLISGTDRIYRGPYIFDGSGTYSIFTHTVDAGIDTTFDRSFGVVLARPGSPAQLVALNGGATLHIGGEALRNDTYFLSDYHQEAQETVYQFGPPTRFDQPLSVELSYDPLDYPDPGKLFVYQKENGGWVRLNSQVFGGSRSVRAFTAMLGEFKLGYDSGYEGSNLVPAEYALQQNYPNPFNPSTTIEYDLPEDGRIALVIYNNLGQKIRTLYEGTQLAGTHRISWDGRDDRGKALASGVYFYTLKAANIVQTKKMLLIH